MPDHLHTFISFVAAAQSINSIIDNGKRFGAYEIIKKMEVKQEKVLPLTLRNNVEAKRKANNKNYMICGDYPLTGSIITVCNL